MAHPRRARALPPATGHRQLHVLPETDLSLAFRKREQDYRVTGEALGDLTDNMWKILVDWMIEVQINYSLSQESLFLAVDILNRYIRLEYVGRGDLQLIGAASLMIASKYEEIYPPEVGEFVYICAGTYTRDLLLDAERDLLAALKYKLSAPLSWHYLNWLGKRVEVNERMLHLAQYYLELTLQERRFATVARSTTAVAAMDLAGRVLDRAPHELQQIRLDSGCSQDSVLDVAKRLNALVIVRQSVDRHAVEHANCRKKYSSAEFNSVGLIQVDRIHYQ